MTLPDRFRLYCCDHHNTVGCLRRTPVLGATDELVYPCSMASWLTARTRTNEFVRATLPTRLRWSAYCRSAILLLAAILAAGGCRPRDEDRSSGPAEANQTQEPGQTAVSASSAAKTQSLSGDDRMPRFARNSPFAGDYQLAAEPQGKRLWARSFLWEKAPEFVVEKWLTPEPDRRGKYVLIEYWATWCGPCRRSIGLLNEMHRRFQDKLVVIGISDESEQAVRALKDPRIEYSVAIDTQARMKTALGVVGIPHVIILEPQGCVVWEGFPLLQGHELTLEVVDRILTAQTRVPAQKP